MLLRLVHMLAHPGISGEGHVQEKRSLNVWCSRRQAMARPAYSSVVSHATDGRPAIVFVPTRKHARLTAMDFLAFAAADGEPSRFLRVRASL